MAFTTPVDIANRALQRAGALRISNLTDTSRNANEANFIYDKLRQAELERNVWRFSTERAVLRKVTATTKLLTFGTWAVGTGYGAGDIVKYTDTSVTPNVTNTWVSLQASNTGNTPGSSTGSFWQLYYGPQTCDTYSTTVTYYIGDIVLASGTYYVSTTDAQSNNTPSGGAPWLSLGTQPTGVTLYRPAPNTQSTVASANTKNAYYLPVGFMRIANQDSKQPGQAYHHSTAGMQFSDFEIEGNYLISANIPSAGADPIFFRFAADIVDVTRMSPMFCEGLGARMGMELCEILTQSQQKYDQCMKAYALFMREARRINAIEVGSTEPEEMDYNPSRLPEASNQPQPQQNQR